MYNLLKYMFQLNEILGNKVPVKILIFFLENPSYEFSETEVRTKLQLARASVNKWLNALFNYKILQQLIRGRMNLYRLNLNSPVVKQFKVLINIIKLLPSFTSSKNTQVFLYGSTARGEDVEDSDIDLLIIGKQPKEILDVIRKVESKLNRRVKPSFYTEFEWSQMSRKDTAFYEHVERDKIRLV